MGFDVEKDWQTEAGFRAVVGVVVRDDGRRSHRCGYVGLPKSHPLHGVGYSQQADCLTQSMADQSSIGKKSPILAFTAACGSDKDGELVRRSPDVVFDVHGGLTYADGDQYPVPHDGLWWFGFDAAHCDDGYIEPYDGFSVRRGGVVRSLEYMAAECESLARQINLIAEAPDEAPPPPDELATLRERVERAEKERDAAKLTAHLYAESVKDRDTLRAENARLREAAAAFRLYAAKNITRAGAHNDPEWIAFTEALAQTEAENG